MAYDDYRLIRIAVDNCVCRATIDHPPINLLDLELLGEIGRLTSEVAADDEVRVVIVDSADPDFFIAHADVSLIQRLPTDDTALHDELTPFNARLELFRTLPKATIAVIEGIARGGGSEFAMAFDMRYAALGKARFGQPEVAVGIIPAGEAIARAKRAVDVALDGQVDLTTGLRIEDQLFRETLAQPVARERLQAIIDAGAQTRAFELGELRPPS